MVEPKSISVLEGLESGPLVNTLPSRDPNRQTFSYENENIQNGREINILKEAQQRSARRLSISSSDNTSDSSVYCPVNAPIVTRQHLGVVSNNKTHSTHSTHSKKQSSHRQSDVDHEEMDENAIYTSILSDQKKKRDRNHRQQKRRRYLSENRVGSLETSPVQSQREYSEDEIEIIQDTKPSYVNLSHREYIENNQNNYQQQHQLKPKREDGQEKFQQPEVKSSRNKATLTNIMNDYSRTSQMINKMSLNQSGINQGSVKTPDRLSDSGSIGSFLSMQSIRAFPKASLPEPLNRVLEPVFVTYYDNMDDEKQSRKKSRHKEKPIATIDGLLNSPKVPQSFLSRPSMSRKCVDIMQEQHQTNKAKGSEGKGYCKGKGLNAMKLVYQPPSH